MTMMEPQMGDIKNNVRILAECRCRLWRKAVWREFRNSPIPAATLKLAKRLDWLPFSCVQHRAHYVLLVDDY